MINSCKLQNKIFFYLVQHSMTKSLLMVFAGVQEILSVCHRYSGFLRARVIFADVYFMIA